ncbi:metalloprotease TldD [Hyphomicrobiales bacterium]|jgi:TldD protein|nr:metalloprotease TldD [Hyphomicrobiales bacterium]MDA8892747.1 metalloprotease TldD [Hyphomicrobiales bacterium]MDA9904671.1 metalloprotease TldD [Hyphomicrobiales bacterium]MDB9926536.1 metalloprotease TldD [Hyphomicrobiales bacterium]|tara:strand:- start:16717 stop:18141 length:1425 start_codon:yes stop_codon:yes gene_type:complete
MDNMFDDIGRDQVSSMVQKALHGSDDGELFFETTPSESFLFDDGRLKNANFDISSGFGSRLVSGDITGYANSTILNKQSIKSSLDAIQTARNGKDIFISERKHPVKESSTDIKKSLYSESNPLNSISFDEKIKLVKNIDEFLRSYDNRVQQVSVSLSGNFQSIMIFNKEGEIVTDERPLVRLNISVIVNNGKRQESGSYGTGGRWDYTRLNSKDFYQNAAKKALSQALTNLDSIDTPAGEMTVILASGWPGVLLHEAVGHGLEGDFNRKGTSAFSNMMGQKVADEQVTVIDNGTIPDRRGSLNIDDEGTSTQETVLIENGILKGYLQDNMNARLMNEQPTGNGRRESFMHQPMPRMTNTYMTNGKYEPDEIIKSVKKGLYMVNFGGGQVDITSGKFVFSCTEGYEIENGKICSPIKGATLIGDGPKALNKIKMVGNDSSLDDGIGTCGKAGQSVPVGVGQPTLRIDEITVGGTS